MLPTRNRVLTIREVGLLACPNPTDAVGQGWFKPGVRGTQ
jgi:hypothetical protein